MSVAPCKNCAERHLNCHDACPKYKEWQLGHEAEKEEERRRARVYDYGMRDAFRGRNRRK